MSYTKDDHAYTRGAGAIAAVDGHRSAQRRAQALAARRAEVRRDRARVLMTRGVLSGDPVHEQDGGTGGAYHPPKTPPRPALPPWMAANPLLRRSTIAPSASRVPSATPPVKRVPAPPTGRYLVPGRKPPRTPPPFPVTSIVTKAPILDGGTATSPIVSGGGGGGGGTTSSTATSPVVDEYTDDDGVEPEDVGTPAATAAAGMSGKKKLALAGGAIALLWLLTRKKKGG